MTKIPLQQKILTYLSERNRPATFYDLMVLGVTSSVAAAVTALLEQGALEQVEDQNVMCVRIPLERPIAEQPEM